MTAEMMPVSSGEPYTVFGKTARDLMLSRGITRQEDLARLLTEVTGEEYKQQRISRYFNGDRPVYRRLPGHLARALNLTEDERRMLADAYAYGQEVR